MNRATRPSSRPGSAAVLARRARRSRVWVAVGAAGAVAARLALGGVGLAQALPGGPGSLFLGQHAYPLVFLAALAESTAGLGLLLPGAAGFPLRRLLALQLPAALLWSGLYAGGGYVLGDQWGRLEQAVRQAGAAGAGAAVLVLGAWWAARRWRRGRVGARVAVPTVA